MGRILKFPRDFLWGVAVSAYQVEGGIENCDWSKVFPAGRACDHYHLYEKDFDLMEQLNISAFRFSIEWSRIEPEKGRFDPKEIEHYRKYLTSLRNRNIKTMVTLHHFTNPVWLAKMGGWANKKAEAYFVRFANKVFNEYKDLADFWITVNEPLVFAQLSYLWSRWPPQKRSPYQFLKVIRNLAVAHREVFEIFHTLKPDSKVGVAKNNQFFEPFEKTSFFDRFSSFLAEYFWNRYFLKRIRNHLDFIGLNYYFHNRIKFPFRIKNENKLVSDLGWEIYPEGIYHVLKDLQQYRVPIYITENGVADRYDELRDHFIRQHLFWIHRAIQKGADVRGYFHWSLMDNFEWDKGIGPKFGLVEVDYKTQRRTPRRSASYYAKICRESALEI